MDVNLAMADCGAAHYLRRSVIPDCSHICYYRSNYENRWPLAQPFMELLFGRYRRQVLGLLLLRPDESLYVRQIARLTDVPAGSLHRELSSLESVGLLLRESAGNHVRYRANRGHPIFKELAEIFRKTSGLADVLREALAPVADRISAAFVFGSMARDDSTADSDVDILVLGAASLIEVVAALAPLHERLGRQVNPVVMTKAAFRREQKAGDRFIRRVMNEPKLFVIGGDDDLG